VRKCCEVLCCLRGETSNAQAAPSVLLLMIAFYAGACCRLPLLSLRDLHLLDSHQMVFSCTLRDCPAVI
jgi:hypothetical protein